MELPKWLSGIASKVAQGMALVPSEQDHLRARRKACADKVTGVYDRKTALEDDVRRLESRLLKLDARRQSEHGVLQRATAREMQAVVGQLKAKEQHLQQAITDIADLDQMISHLDSLLHGQPVTSSDWDELAVDLEGLMDETREAGQARRQVQGLSPLEQPDLAGDGDVEEALSEIRGPSPSADPALEDRLKQLRQRRPTETET